MTRKEKEQLLQNIESLSTRFTTPTFGGTVIDTITLEKIIDAIPVTEEKPTELYAILDADNDKIIFNARGGCYRDKNDAERKIRQLINSTEYADNLSYRVVTYKLQE